LVRSYQFTVEAARLRTQEFCAAGDIRLVPIGAAEFALAVEAYARYGKGRHPASLNMGDCHAYACTKAHGATLLFKGDDFSRTDLAQSAP
jgi:ribonuclease VapC